MSSSVNKNRATLSFIVPAYNEDAELPATLRAIHKAAKCVEYSYEIIVVDDASTDNTATLAQQLGARVVSISCRHIAAARNAGAHAAEGEILVFVDADTHIARAHVDGVMSILRRGCVGGGARVKMEGTVPLWSRAALTVFSFVYFGMNMAAGAFLFTTRANFFAVGGFDETYFAGEEVFFSLALRRQGVFKILRTPVITSGRKLRLYSGRKLLQRFLAIIVNGPKSVRARDKLDLWYGGEREGKGECLYESGSQP